MTINKLRKSTANMSGVHGRNRRRINKACLIFGIAFLTLLFLRPVSFVSATTFVEYNSPLDVILVSGTNSTPASYLDNDDASYYTVEHAQTINWTAGFQTSIATAKITKIAVMLKGYVNETADTDYLQMWNHTDSAWVTVIDTVDDTTETTRWFNTTSSTDITNFIEGTTSVMNLSFYINEVAGDGIESYTNFLAIYIEYSEVDVGEFQAPATAYGFQEFLLNVSVSDQDGQANLKNCSVTLTGGISFYWESGAPDTWAESIDPTNLGLISSSNSLKTSINSTSYKLSFALTLFWNYTEGQVSVTAKVFDNDDNFVSSTATDLFYFEDDLIVSTASVDDSRVNPSDTIKFTGNIYYEGTTTAPASDEGITVSVELAGTLKGSNTTVSTTTGAFQISGVTAEASVAQHGYNIYATTDQNTVTNQTVNVIVDSLTVDIVVGDGRININENATINVSATYDYDSTAFDGTFTLNYTTYTHATAIRRRYTVSSVSGDTYGITTISINDIEAVIWDSLTVDITVTDPRINVNDNASIYVSATYDFDSTPFDGTFTLNYTTYTHVAVGRWRYTVQSVTGDSFGITVIGTNDIEAVIWDSLTAYITVVDNRINVNDNATIYVNATYNFDNLLFDGTFTLNYTTYTHAAVGRWRYTVQSVAGDTYGITSISTNDIEAVVWDSLTVSITVLDSRININDNASIYVSATYNFDSTAFDGTFTLNYTTYQHAAVGRWRYTVSSVAGDTHGITVIGTNDIEAVIWDSLTIAITVLDSRINVNDNASIYVSATYDFDNAPFDGSFTLNYTTYTHAAVGRWRYTVQTVSGDTYGITTIATNDIEAVIWDSLTIDITVSDGRININDNASIYVSATYNFDSTAFDGSFTLNYTTYIHATAMRRRYTVSSVLGDTYGITVIGTNDIEAVIWDSLTVEIIVLDNHINVNDNASIYVNATYDFDNTLFDGTFTLNYTTYTHAAMGRWRYTVQSVSGDTFGITAIGTNDIEAVIWDSLTVVITVSDGRINLNDNASIYVSVTYDFDSTAFDGTFTLNYTTYMHNVTAIRRRYTVSSVSGDTYGITAISTNDVGTVIWDSLTISITVTDNRVNVGVNASIYISAIYDFDSTPYDGDFQLNDTSYSQAGVGYRRYTVLLAENDTYGISWISTNDIETVIWDSLTITITVTDSRININDNASIYISATYDFDSAAFDGDFLLNDTTYQQAGVGYRRYTVITAENDTYGITIISLNDVETVIWDSLTITITVTDARISTGDNASIYVSAVYDFDNTAFDGDFLLNDTTYTQMGVGYRRYEVSLAENDTFGIDVISTNDVETVIWDSLTLTITVSDSRINVNDNASIYVSAVYDYDATPFDGDFLLNYTIYNHSTVGLRRYNVSLVENDTYGITSFTNNPVETIIWDKLTVTLSADAYAAYLNVQVNFTVTAIRQFDGSRVTPFTVWIDRNGTVYTSGNFTDIRGTDGRWNYTTHNATDATFGIVVFDTNIITIIWSTTPIIQIDISWVSDPRVDISTLVGIAFHCRWSNNLSSLDTGTLYVNGSSYSINTTGWAEIFSSQVSVIRLRWTVTGVNAKGLTGYQQLAPNPVVIWDRLTLTITVIDNRINVGDNATIYVNATYNYDNTLFDGDFLLNDTVYTQGGVGYRRYNVSLVENDTHGITVFGNNPIVTVIWDSLTLTIIVGDPRINVNANATINISATYDFDNSPFDGNFLLNNTIYTKASYGILRYNVSLVENDTYGITAFSNNPVETIIWDSLTISITVVDNRINVNDNATIYVSATYDYDSTPFDGTLTLNWTFYQQAIVGKAGYTVLLASGGSHGISYISVNDAEFVIWDKLTITITPTETIVDLDTQVNFTVSAVRRYDGSRVSPLTLSIFKNSTPVATGNFTQMYSVETVYVYLVDSANDPLYGISEFDYTSIMVIWAPPKVEVYTVTVSDTRVTIDTDVTLAFFCRWSLNQSTITSGILYVNATSYTINSTGWASFTTSSSSVGKLNYQVTGANVNGVTDYIPPALAQIIWDRILVESSGSTPGSVNVHNPVTVYFVLKYEYDSALVTDGTVLVGSHSASYSSTGQRWEFSVTQDEPGTLNFTVTAVSGNTYGITAINHQAPMVQVTWAGAEPLPDPTLLLIAAAVGLGAGLPIIYLLRRRGRAPRAPKPAKKPKAPKVRPTPKPRALPSVPKVTVNFNEIRQNLPSYSTEALRGVLSDLDRMAERYSAVYAEIPRELTGSEEAKRIGDLVQQINELRLRVRAEIDRRWTETPEY